jgi:hypothetical protein
MKTLTFFLLLLSFTTSAFAVTETDFDFSFQIKGDHFSLEIQQVFKKPLIEIRKKFNPNFLPQISNVVISAESKKLSPTQTKVSITSSKHRISSTTVSNCTEQESANEWISTCYLDLNSEDTGDYFYSGTEKIHCISTGDKSQCTFTLNAGVKPQKFLFVYRSSEVLALGGIMERIHDQAVLSRVLNLNETPETAKIQFEESTIGNCIDQIYSYYQKSTQGLEFMNKPLVVQSSQWKCDP